MNEEKDRARYRDYVSAALWVVSNIFTFSPNLPTGKDRDAVNRVCLRIALKVLCTSEAVTIVVENRALGVVADAFKRVNAELPDTDSLALALCRSLNSHFLCIRAGAMEVMARAYERANERGNLTDIHESFVTRAAEFAATTIVSYAVKGCVGSAVDLHAAFKPMKRSFKDIREDYCEDDNLPNYVREALLKTVLSVEGIVECTCWEVILGEGGGRSALQEILHLPKEELLSSCISPFPNPPTTPLVEFKYFNIAVDLKQLSLLGPPTPLNVARRHMDVMYIFNALKGFPNSSTSTVFIQHRLRLLRLLNLHVSRSRECVESANCLLLTADALLNGVRIMGLNNNISTSPSSSTSGCDEKSRGAGVFNERTSHFVSLRYGVEKADMIENAVEAIGPRNTNCYRMGEGLASIVYDIVGITKLAVKRLIDSGHGSLAAARLLLLNSFLASLSELDEKLPRFLPVRAPTLSNKEPITERFFHMKLSGAWREGGCGGDTTLHEYSEVRFLLENEGEDDGWIVRIEDEEQIVELCETCKHFYKVRCTGTSLKIVKNESAIKWGNKLKIYLLVREVKRHHDVFIYEEKERENIMSSSASRSSSSSSLSMASKSAAYKIVEAEGDAAGVFGETVLNRVKACAL